jgi:hypothetical protein
MNRQVHVKRGPCGLAILHKFIFQQNPVGLLENARKALTALAWRPPSQNFSVMGDVVMLKRTLLCMALIGSCGLMANAEAQQFIYKWNDEQGQPKYSELPPPSGVPYETVRKPGGEAPGAEAGRDLTKEQEELARKLAEEEAKTQEQQEQAQKAADEQRAKNCEIAKKNVAVLQGDRPVVRADAKGDKVTLSAEERAAELQKAQKDQDYFCNP